MCICCLRIANNNDLTICDNRRCNCSRSRIKSVNYNNALLYLRNCSMCFLAELNDLFAACVFGNNTLFKLGYVIGISKCTLDNRVSELNVRRKLCLSVLGNILCIAIVCERK